MAELAAFALLAGAGYLMAKLRADARPVATEQSVYASPGLGVVGTAAGDRPSMRTMYESRHLDEVRADETWRATDRSIRALDPSHGRPGVVTRTDRDAPPAFKGVGRSADGAFVRSQLLGVNVPVERFRHNNMVPFYGGSVKQPTADDAYAGKLETFTGGFEYRPMGLKKEIDPLFVPVPDGMVTSGGSAAAVDIDTMRANYLATMPMPRNRANEAPGGMAPEIVGRPGVRGGTSGDVYYDMREYAKGPGIDELRPGSRPKLSFEGRVLPGQAIAPPSDAARHLPVVAERRYEPLTREMTGVDDLLRTTGAVVGEQARERFEARETSRQSTSQPYVGSASAATRKGTDGRETGIGPSRESLRVGLGEVPVGSAVAADGGARSGDYGKASVLVYGNNRDVTSVRAHVGGIVSAVKALVAPLQDAVRPTRKDTEAATNAPRAFGNAGAGAGAAMQPKLTVYDTNDVARTTLKQLSAQEATPLGNIRGADYKTTSYFDPDTGAARTTIRQTTQGEAPAVNLLGGAKRAIVYDPDDVARVARKQTTLAATEAANMRGAFLAGVVFDPEDIARVARKQTTLQQAELANVRSGRNAGVVYDDDDMARPTTKQTTLDAGDRPLRNVGGAANRTANVAYDPDGWVARTTTRQALTDAHPGVPEDGSVGALQGRRAGAYATTEVDPRRTMRQVDAASSQTAYGQAATEFSARGGYEVAPDDLKDTQRQDLADNDYYGGGANERLMPSSQEAALASTARDDREMAERHLHSHGPTPVGAAEVAQAAALGAYVSNSSAADLLRMSGATRRAPSPGRPQQLARDAGMSDGGYPIAGQLGEVASPKRFVEADLVLAGADRLSLEIAGASMQRSGNPVALRKMGDL